MKNILFLFIFFVVIVVPDSVGQKSDTLTTLPDSSGVKKHSTKAATIMSAVVPGLGQVYNRKYWKVPLIYGGLITAGYFFKSNREQYLLFRKDYIAEVDNLPSTVNQSGYPSGTLQSYMNSHRMYMEISFIALSLLYIMNVVDATVDAHLFTFDVSDNLSLNVRPEIYQSFSTNTPYAGVRMTFKL